MSPRLGGGPSALIIALATALLASAAPSTAQASAPAAVEPAGAVEDTAPDPLFDDDEEWMATDYQSRDPFEGANRVVLSINERIDWLVFDPVTKLYRLALPEAIRRGVHRALANANAPPVIVNKLLQLRFKEAGIAVGRFALNSTAGFGGLFDAAKEAGWNYDHADFGQTLAQWGSPSGPYLIVPLLGPSTARDGVGDVVDLFFNPVTYFLGPVPQIFSSSGYGFSRREANLETIHALRDSSIDYYSVLRSAYLQHRDAALEVD
jgi:phospholipid-binding lipoprotein MlaA